MPKYELIKLIEARKLNKRTGLAEGTKWTPIPFGAIIDNLVTDRDLVKFTYLGELYQSKEEDLMPAIKPAGGEEEEAAPPPPPPAPPPTAAAAAPQAVAGPALAWQQLNASPYTVRRAKVPGGWLVAGSDGRGFALAFYPDAGHAWNGVSLE